MYIKRCLYKSDIKYCTKGLRIKLMCQHNKESNPWNTDTYIDQSYSYHITFNLPLITSYSKVDRYMDQSCCIKTTPPVLKEGRKEGASPTILSPIEIHDIKVSSRKFPHLVSHRHIPSSPGFLTDTFLPHLISSSNSNSLKTLRVTWEKARWVVCGSAGPPSSITFCVTSCRSALTASSRDTLWWEKSVKIPLSRVSLNMLGMEDS